MKEEMIERTFMVGSPWIYYKIYCGINTADSLLINTIAPMNNEFIGNGIVDKWFFVRYADPDTHLRIRFHLKNTDHIGVVVQRMYKALEPFLKDGLVWNIQLDTYKRELERYGKNMIEALESYFYYDSEVVLRIIKDSPTEEVRFKRTFDFIHDMVDCFIPSTEKKLAFLKQMQSNYMSEFNIDNAKKKQLNKKYRHFKNEIKNLKNSNNVAPLKSIAVRLKEMKKTNSLEMPLENLLGSMVHMTVNRAFQSRQRHYEMVLYDFLYQKTKSEYYICKSKK